jgi:hypothetical protein
MMRRELCRFSLPRISPWTPPARPTMIKPQSSSPASESHQVILCHFKTWNSFVQKMSKDKTLPRKLHWKRRFAISYVGEPNAKQALQSSSRCESDLSLVRSLGDSNMVSDEMRLQKRVRVWKQYFKRKQISLFLLYRIGTTHIWQAGRSTDYPTGKSSVQ